MFGIIKENAEDQIILGDNKIEEFFYGLIFIIFFGGILWILIPNMIRDQNTLGLLEGGLFFLFLLLFGSGFLFGIFLLLFKRKIIIDKKFRKVIIERKWITGELISTKIIYFSDIKDIEIKITYNSECADTWSANLKTKSGDLEMIYNGGELDVKEMADKISKLTNLSILGPTRNYQV
jgi:hypothetical protein